MKSKSMMILAGMLLASPWLPAATYYVATTGSDTTGNGTSGLPYQTIQRAVTQANPGDTVLVSPGTYAAGEVNESGSGKSRVAITKNITVRSTQGAQRTIIRGRKNSEDIPYGVNSVRCVYMTTGVLDGFTLLEGYANAFSPPLYQMDASVINGGGVCVPVGNRTPEINNCIITGCSAYRGGGAYWGTLNNCTVVYNRSNTPNNGGGVWGCAVNNSIVRFNLLDDFSLPDNTVDTSVFSFCCLPSIPGTNRDQQVRDGGGNIIADPKFIAGTYSPARDSPCINMGANLYARGALDAAGGPRIVGSSVDIGAYEANFLPYQLTVIDGGGSGIYTNGDIVAIAATNAASEWMTFIGWTGDTNTVANVMLAETTLVMPANNITVTANYLTAPIDQVISEGLGIPLPIATSNVTVFSVNPAVPSVTLGPVDDGDVAFFETVYTNAGTVVFSWNVSSEEGWDFLNFYVDDVLKAQISGEVSGVVTQFVADAGPHKLKWEYSKDNWPGTWSGMDSGDVGPILWIPDDLASELAVPGPLAPPAFPYGQPGAALPFPYGFAACFLDRNPPPGATNGLAVRLGGTNGVAPLVANNQATGAEVLLNGAGTLSFRWYTSCQTGDRLVCSVDGVEKASLTGERARLGALAWTNVTLELAEPVPHLIRWSYVKDTDGANGGDCGWIDNATWTRATCTLTVQDGSGSGTYFIGDTATIIATNVTPLQVFEQWTGDIENVAAVNSMTTTVFMASDTVVSANYKVKYALTVTGGTGSGTYFGGQVIPVAATIPAGMVFDAWTGNTEYLADPDIADTTLTMPERDVSLTALVKVEPYRVSVVNGWEAGSLPNVTHEGFGEPQGVYPPGAAVRIVANPAPLWKTFDGWTSVPGVTIDDPTSDITWFTMPASSVALTANYRDQTEEEKLANALTIRGQPLVVTDYSTNGVVALSSGGVRYNDPVVMLGGASVGRNESVLLETTSFAGDGILLFWWRGDSEASNDGLSVEVDGTPITPILSEKSTNTVDRTLWYLHAYSVSGAGTITFRYSRDDSYITHENYLLLDRVTWIPKAMVDALDTSDIPNINQEFDPCFNRHPKTETGLHAFSGEDGGVRWDPAESAIKIGAFGVVTNNQLAQVGFLTDDFGFKPAGGILKWQWMTRSESEYDRLEFMLDLIPTNWISGKNTGWVTNTFVLKKEYARPAESPITDVLVTWPVFNFRYVKDYDQSFLEDSGWVRNNIWYPTYNLGISGGTNTVLVFPDPDFAINPDILSEAAKGVIPAGTEVTIVADPAPDGMVFAGWTGELGGVVNPGLAIQTFTMPHRDILITSTYAAPPSPVQVKPQIMNFTLDVTPVQTTRGGLFAAMSLPSLSVGITFESAPGVNYEVEWTPSLSGPECVWTVLPVTSLEVVGTTADGHLISKLMATAPSDTKQGFLRLKIKE